MSNSAAFDDEYTVADHSAPLAVMAGVFGQGGGLCDHTFELRSLKIGNEALRVQEAMAHDALPPTWFADRPLSERVELLVQAWQRAIDANKALEERLETAVESWKRDEQITREELADLRRRLEVAEDGE
jgi:hypothetical protein